MEGAPCRRRCPSLVGDPAAEEWSPWSVCSLTCGQGLQVRTRSCVSSPYGTLCSGPLRETRPCNNSATCPGTPIRPTPSACRVRSPRGLGRLIFLSFSEVTVLHTVPSPTQGTGDSDESDQGPHEWARFRAHHSPLTLGALRVPYALTTPTPFALSHLPAFP